MYAHIHFIWGDNEDCLKKMYFLSTKIANYAELTCKLLPQIRGLMVSF